MLNPYENAGSVETPEETEEERLMREAYEREKYASVYRAMENYDDMS